MSYKPHVRDGRIEGEKFDFSKCRKRRGAEKNKESVKVKPGTSKRSKTTAQPFNAVSIHFILSYN